jgi:hypothetical protein
VIVERMSTAAAHSRELAGLVHRDEFVFSAAAVRRNRCSRTSKRCIATLGAPVTLSADPAPVVPQAPAFRRGSLGRSSKQALFLDMKAAHEWLRNRDGDKYIIDLVNARGGHLRT